MCQIPGMTNVFISRLGFEQLYILGQRSIDQGQFLGHVPEA